MNRGLFYAISMLYFLALLSNKFQLTNKNLELKIYDVGQGGSIHITYNNLDVLIDGGETYEVDDLLTSSFPLFSCNLDVVFLTHPHMDHLGGLIRSLKRCNSDLLVFNDVYYSSDSYLGFLDFYSKKYFVKLHKDLKFVFNDLQLIVLWPTKVFLQSNYNNLNNISTVLLLRYKDFDALLTGDIEREVYENLDTDEILSLINGRLDVFKASHHGSINGLDEKFVAKLDPRFCVISVGESNKFGHPSTDVVKFFESIDCKVFRTDEDGTIVFKVL
jgi:competence protein ComEC